MNPRPFHRWKSFWIGIFVIASLCWGWERSVHFWETLCLSSPRSGNCVMLVQGNGGLRIILLRNPGGMIGASGFPLVGSAFFPVSIWSYSFGSPHFQFPWPLEWESSKNTNSLGIAYWFLILLFATIWIIWMVRRARRFKRLVSLQGRDPTSGRSGWGESP